ncbi:hypothetical protein PAPYR_4191 [Paratrimastix pyriformis]|uniref:Uncharacterized protein n=1 Tax=Paratrimastix pyriformis TaxID=342808 RepID=A0ABQ8UKR0_9EUKA|nr:hypothetical protein PAPYR_4191 [Paratrimastix pyriformis]
MLPTLFFFLNRERVIFTFNHAIYFTVSSKYSIYALGLFFLSSLFPIFSSATRSLLAESQKTYLIVPLLWAACLFWLANVIIRRVYGTSKATLMMRPAVNTPILYWIALMFFVASFASWSLALGIMWASPLLVVSPFTWAYDAMLAIHSLLFLACLGFIVFAREPVASLRERLA